VTKEKKQYAVGITCGSFDLIHPGYVRMFRDSKTICETLVVALQGDPTIDRPNKCKPVQSIDDRIEVLSAIAYIDHIVTYNIEAELLQLLKDVNHDVRILGSDYRDNSSYTGAILGKPVYYHERDHEYSTTALKEAVYRERLNFKKKLIE
jgi:glycerol-3-phosphate cytidylyltransferase